MNIKIMILPVLMCVGFSHASDFENTAVDKLNRFMTTTNSPKGIIIGRGTKQGIKEDQSETIYLRGVSSWAYVEPNPQYQDLRKDNAIVGKWPLSLDSSTHNKLDAFVFDFGTTDHIGMDGNIQKRDDKKRQAIAPAISMAYALLKKGGMLVVPCDMWRYQGTNKSCSVEEAMHFLLSVLPVSSEDLQRKEWRSEEGSIMNDARWNFMTTRFGITPCVAIGEIEPDSTENSPVLPDELSKTARESREFNGGLGYRIWKWFEIVKE